MTTTEKILLALIGLLIVIIGLSLWHTGRVLEAWAIDQAYWISRVKELSR